MAVNMPELGTDETPQVKSVADCITDQAGQGDVSYYDQIMREMYGGQQVQPMYTSQPVVTRKINKKPKKLHIPVEDDTLLGGFSGLGRMSEEEARALEKHMARSNDDEFL